MATEINSLVTSRSHILIVDNDAVNLQILANVLSTEPYDIEIALSGTEALKKLEEATFDMVISDLKVLSVTSTILSVSPVMKTAGYGKNP
ncbi:response regulator [Lysinibacillus parviboronicapiens]|uniref:response regulator n=1 Tax=Lysinibacillus parviboronicapiens TaxID=436516 RepID=UPI00187D6AEF|nr:response regulator [Lysinibacillus parviboronicapiens]